MHWAPDPVARNPAAAVIAAVQRHLDAHAPWFGPQAMASGLAGQAAAALRGLADCRSVGRGRFMGHGATPEGTALAIRFAFQPAGAGELDAVADDGRPTRLLVEWLAAERPPRPPSRPAGGARPRPST